MKIDGLVWKSRTDKWWLIEVPLLNLMTQAETKEEAPAMMKDAIESLVDDPRFSVDVEFVDNNRVTVSANDQKKLVALILKRQRRKYNLTLEEVMEHLGAKSINEYAQYEQAKHMPSFEKLEKLLLAINPDLTPIVGIPRQR